MKLLAPGNALCCNRVCCCQSCPQKQQLTSLTSASKSSRVSFVKAIPCLAWLWASSSASIAHAPPAEYHQLPVFKTTNRNSKQTNKQKNLKLQAKCQEQLLGEGRGKTTSHQPCDASPWVHIQYTSTRNLQKLDATETDLDKRTEADYINIYFTLLFCHLAPVVHFPL